MSTETVCVLRGAVRQSFFEEVDAFVTSEGGLPMAQETDGVARKSSLKLVEEIVVEAGSSCPMYVVPAGMWHTTEALVPGTIIFEAKDGKYGEDGSESIKASPQPSPKEMESKMLNPTSEKTVENRD